MRVRILRAALVPATLILFVLVSGFLAQVPWATGLWPWPAKPLSYIFIASILAAIAVPVLWIAVSGEAAAIRAGALDLTVMYGAMFVYVLTLTGHPHEPRLWAYALAFGLAATGSAGAFLFARPIPWADPRSMPQLVRLSFGAFAMILVGAGAALVAHAGIFPWQLGQETSVMFGLIFLGAATYFIYGALDPHWSLVDRRARLFRGAGARCGLRTRAAGPGGRAHRHRPRHGRALAYWIVTAPGGQPTPLQLAYSGLGPRAGDHGHRPGPEPERRRGRSVCALANRIEPQFVRISALNSSVTSGW